MKRDETHFFTICASAGIFNQLNGEYEIYRMVGEHIRRSCDMSRVIRVVVLQGILFFWMVGFSWAAGNFTDNKDGTITDSATALMWQKTDDGIERTWDDAVAYCESLEFDGYSDWMLPKIHMLENLVESGFSPTINPLFSVKPSYYWSASESRASAKSAKYVNFFYGNSYTFSKDNTYYSICVRDLSVYVTDPLQASFRLTTSSEKEPYEVSFSSLITGGTKPYFFEWDFGDGDFSSLSNPTHIFQKDGKYEVILTVSDNDGTIAAAKKEIPLPLLIEPDEVVEAESMEAAAASEPMTAVLEKKEVEAEQQTANDEQAQEIGTLSPEAQLPAALGAAAGSAAAELALSAEKTPQDGEADDFIEKKPAAPVDEDAMPSEAAADNAQPEQPQEVVQENPEDQGAPEETMPADLSETSGNHGDNETRTEIEKAVEKEIHPQQEDASAGNALISPETGVQELTAQESADQTGKVTDQNLKGVLRAFASKKSGPGQTASGGPGLLAYSFMNALSGDADWNKDGKVTARELKGYLELAIDNLSAGRQEAALTMNDGDFSLCAAGGVTHVLAVGVDGYREETIEPLTFAAESAESIVRALAEKCSSWRKLVLTGPNTGRNNIFRALVKMRTDIGPSDNFIFYFAGSLTKEESGLNFLAYDTLPELRAQTGISYDDLTPLLENIPAKNIIMLFEAGPYVEE
jgi:PKD repeat protein